MYPCGHTGGLRGWEREGPVAESGLFYLRGVGSSVTYLTSLAAMNKRARAFATKFIVLNHILNIGS